MSTLDKPVIIGRSSSHFTRIARLFAAELHVDHSFQSVRDLLSKDPADYGGNPALRIPVLKTSRGVWFGALNASRELWRQSNPRPRVVWPEALDVPLLANMQELTLQAMATEVTLVMEKMAGAGEGTTHALKLRESLLNMMAWLEQNASAALATLPPERDLSYLEVTLFCLVTHLEFRDVLPTAPYPTLNRFCQQFAKRPSASSTDFRFDT
ncbi:glutathione S-transferase domain-containing protein [Corallococcus praedator]|uniref:Glutathione S-transferase domain-containing protein n=1 Tax=Corallococcus praedator TaxID=2316724 RepID=A0ABX9QJL5_9BACT|nr:MULTISPECIES: glutathione S-transferase N-terminal domain-containing protein [Corallococcus]RKH32534.1 glutathione S-transferase domain-containing protein [Corallococcus sp. CA031C]RKI10469.1 glutathione S-transferase domain-containing protein [Corallococcus praedator]